MLAKSFLRTNIEIIVATKNKTTKPASNESMSLKNLIIARRFSCSVAPSRACRRLTGAPAKSGSSQASSATHCLCARILVFPGLARDGCTAFLKSRKIIANFKPRDLALCPHMVFRLNDFRIIETAESYLHAIIQHLFMH
jgi:hypothetical protein